MSSKVIDPVCGMEVDPATSAGSFEYKGTTYHFCSIRCRDKFKNDPDSFVARATPLPSAVIGSAFSPAAAEALDGRRRGTRAGFRVEAMRAAGLRMEQPV